MQDVFRKKFVEALQTIQKKEGLSETVDILVRRNQAISSIRDGSAPAGFDDSIDVLKDFNNKYTNNLVNTQHFNKFIGDVLSDP